MSPVAHNEGFDLPYHVAGDAGSPTLVFAHGLMGVEANDRSNLTPLVDAGWRVVTFCQRGHSEATPVTNAADYDPVAMGRDLWAVADDVGVDRCWIGGGSMGAATSWCAAGANPARVEGLMQVVPALRDTDHPMVAIFDIAADTVRASGIEGLIKLLTDLAAGQGGEPDLAFFEGLKTHNQSSLELALRNVPRWILSDVPSGFADLPYPVIVLGWDQDPIHPLQTAKDIAASAGVKLLEYDAPFPPAERHRVGQALLEALATV